MQQDFQKKQKQLLRRHQKNLKDGLMSALKKSGMLSRGEKHLLPVLLQKKHVQNLCNSQKIKSDSLNTVQNGIHCNLDLDQLYQIKQKIGWGSQSTVYRCIEKQNNQNFAVKVIRQLGQQVIAGIKQTYLLMKKIDHKNIIKVKHFFMQEDTQRCQIVSELCYYKDLRVYMEQQKALGLSISQENACDIIKQILSALLCLKEARVCHRDIKPENILYCPETNELKLIDFDIARAAKSQDEPLDLWTDAGSIYYRAPESLRGGYDERVDMWAVGVIAYELITSKLPFFSTSKSVIRSKISSEVIDYAEINASEDFRDFVKALLERNPQSRLTPKQAIDSNIFADRNHLNKSINDGQTEPGTPNDAQVYFIDIDNELNYI